MFDKQKEITIKDAETIIGQSIKVKGDFQGQGNIIIDGSVDGSIKTQSFLLIGDKAMIIADIEAKDAKISGDITGNIKVKGYLEITKTAKINGDIETSLISIERGAIINGKCNSQQSQNNTKPKTE